MRKIEPPRCETMTIRLQSEVKDYITKRAATFKLSPSGAVNQILEDWVTAEKADRAKTRKVKKR